MVSMLPTDKRKKDNSSIHTEMKTSYGDKSGAEDFLVDADCDAT